MNNKITSFVHTHATHLESLYEHEEEREQAVWWLLEAITNKSQAELIAHDEKITKNQIEKLHELIVMHAREKIPLQYLIGWVPFAQTRIFVEPPTLIPRPETEEWTLKLLKMLTKLGNSHISILELCTGSGCIAIALARTLPNASIDATDTSHTALALAKKNAEYNKVSNIHFIQSDVYDQLNPHNQYDLIIANPPYITPHEWQQLSPMVTKWEDKHALVAENDGVAIIQRIISNAPSFLKKNTEFIQHNIPQLWIEIGYTQGTHVQTLAEKAGFSNVHIEKDLSGKERLIHAQYYLSEE